MARILLVDDDDLVRATIAAALGDAGHDVVQAGDGRSALAALERATVDAVVLDVLMPDMDGIETVRAIRERSSDLPILAISGGVRWGSWDALSCAQTLGADSVLSKPFASEDLLLHLNTLLSSRKREPQ